MRNLPPLFKVPVKYALIAGLLGAVLIVFLYYVGRHPLLIPIIFDYRLLLLPLFLFFTMKEYRDVHNEKVMHFWEGMSIGFILYVAMGLVLGGFIFLLSVWIDPGFLNDYISISIEQLVNNKQEFLDAIGEEAYQASLEILPQTTAVDLALDYLIKTCAIGLLMTIIISVILRR